MRLQRAFSMPELDAFFFIILLSQEVRTRKKRNRRASATQFESPGFRYGFLLGLWEAKISVVEIGRIMPKKSDRRLRYHDLN